jgi:hypothetical protein
VQWSLTQQLVCSSIAFFSWKWFGLCIYLLRTSQVASNQRAWRHVVRLTLELSKPHHAITKAITNHPGRPFPNHWPWFALASSDLFLMPLANDGTWRPNEKTYHTHAFTIPKFMRCCLRTKFIMMDVVCATSLLLVCENLATVSCSCHLFMFHVRLVTMPGSRSGRKSGGFLALRQCKKAEHQRLN